MHTTTDYAAAERCADAIATARQLAADPAEHEDASYLTDEERALVRAYREGWSDRNLGCRPGSDDAILVALGCRSC